MSVDQPSATELLLRAGAGETGAADSMFPLVYDELRRLAHLHLSRELSARTLGTTELVHEAYLRLAVIALSNGFGRDNPHTRRAVALRDSLR